jgi:hypothetical protein
MKSILLALFVAGGISNAQTKLEMPMLASPLPSLKFELSNAISAGKFTALPKELPAFKWTHQPRPFPVAALQSLIAESAFAETNLPAVAAAATNGNIVKDDIRLVTSDNQDYLIVTPLAGRIALRNADRNSETPPADAVPDFDAVWQRAQKLVAAFGVTTNELERRPDGSIHVRKAEDDISRLGGAIKFKDRRSVMVFRSINGYVIRSLDEDKVELELGVNGRLLKFDFKWPTMEPVSTNRVLAVSQVIDGIRKGQVLADAANEYPSGGIDLIELTDFQIFYYVSTMQPYGKPSGSADIKPMIEFVAKFKSKSGEETEGSLFAPITDSP